MERSVGQRLPIHASRAEPPVIVISRSHQDDELKEYLSQLGAHQTVAVGSSLKFCLVGGR